MLKLKRKLSKHGKEKKSKMVSYIGFLADLIIDNIKTAIDYNLSYIPTELVTEGVDPTYATIPCIAAEQTLTIAPYQSVIIISSLIANILSTLSASITHHPVDHFYSYSGAQLYVLYGLPASVFGYVRAVSVKSLGNPIPFIDIILDGALPTGLHTNNLGVSSTAFQKLIYTPKGQRSEQEFEGESIDYTGVIPASVTVTVRRKVSSKLNKRRMR